MSTEVQIESEANKVLFNIPETSQQVPITYMYLQKTGDCESFVMNTLWRAVLEHGPLFSLEGEALD